jgi:hypothetical protein
LIKVYAENQDGERRYNPCGSLRNGEGPSHG